MQMTIEGVISNTRIELEQRDGCRFLCRAVVERFGTKPAYRGPAIETILLRNVVEAKTGVVLTDHLWFATGKWSQGLKAGDRIAFEARSASYLKGYRGRREDVYDAPVRQDWRLQRPTQVRVVAGPHPDPDSTQSDLLNLSGD